MSDPAGPGDLGRGVRDTADDSLRRDRFRDDSPWVDRIERGPVKPAAVALEVPPGDTVLCRHNDGVRPEQPLDLVHDRSDLVCLDPKDYKVLGTALPHVAGRGDARGVNDYAVGECHLEPAGADRLEMRTPRNDGDVLTCLGETRSEQPADGSRPYDTNPHLAIPCAPSTLPAEPAAFITASSIDRSRQLRRYILKFSGLNIASPRRRSVPARTSAKTPRSLTETPFTDTGSATAPAWPVRRDRRPRNASPRRTDGIRTGIGQYGNPTQFSASAVIAAFELTR